MSRPGVAGLHVLVDDDPRWPFDPVEQALRALPGGPAVVQLRAKHARDRETLAWARAIRVAAADANVLFFVNDRFDLALAAGADGVHLGRGDLPPSRLPDSARQKLLVGCSSHDLSQVREVREERPDYIAFGPAFGTTSKDSEYGPRGLAMVSEAVRLAAPLPLIAIGGIDSENASELARAGVRGIAVIGAVAAARDAASAVRALRRGFSGGGDG